MSKSSTVCLKIVAIACILGIASRANAEKTAAELAPKSAMVYIEIAQPIEVIAYTLDHREQ